MKKTLIALASATLAIMASPAAAAELSAPNPATQSIVAQNIGQPASAAETLAETAELRGRRGSFRRGRIGGFRNRGHFRGSRFHNRGFKGKRNLHFKHHDAFVHDSRFKHRRVIRNRTFKKGFKGKRFGHRRY